MALKWYERLDPDQVVQIKSLRRQGKSLSKIASEFRISTDVVQTIYRELQAESTDAAAELLASKSRRYKTWVIEHIFNQRWNEGTGRIGDALVTLQQVSDAIKEHNRQHPAAGERRAPSDRNVANFFKDFARNIQAANRYWPRSVFEKGYTGWQQTGEGRCFEFTNVPEGQQTPFDAVPVPPESDAREIGTLTIPLASQRLGRADESWLTQVLVRPGLVETHFAVASSRTFLEIVHLQMNVKQSGSEIDSIYRATERVGVEERDAILICETKGKRDDIIISQLVSQAQAALNMDTLRELYNRVTPVAVKVIGDSQVQIVEFEEVLRDGV